MPEFQRDYLFQKEVAQQLGISTRTISRLISRGGFPKGYSISSKRVWSIESIQKWMQAQKEQTQCN